MSATVRLNRLSVLGTGAFGARVSELLPNISGLAITRVGPEIPGDMLADADAAVLVLDRPARRLARRFRQVASETGKPWLLVEFDHPVIRVGPYFDPAGGPCLDCFYAREDQHADEPALLLKPAHKHQHEHKDEHAHAPDCSHAGAPASAEEEGPGIAAAAGVLPHQARIAAGLMILSLAEQVRGRVVTVDLRTAAIRSDQVIGCHGCPHCGDETERTLLSRQLNHLFRTVGGVTHDEHR
ncbi:TOMM precursor leader peptide-binding protein [Streptomyces microflavus]|uniref:TOMM leader peptide-binding protein n=1 Tax=Streptomyces microflavus TaxID=1919 RepID=A0A7H8N023_STRMI|nr:TOMM precursor leader peptide-binding protein [Streptomyces microflavus]QKW47815.1 TOMM precursor leader peptide-binding protein [Streptomyces microflavus]WSR89187.1 TOMM precursor leader peptide-binding protein [Streptomyces microflavus]